MKCTALRGESGAMIDACIHLATIDDRENKTCTVQSQCISNSAAIYMMVLKICTGTYFMKTGILPVK